MKKIISILLTLMLISENILFSQSQTYEQYAYSEGIIGPKPKEEHTGSGDDNKDDDQGGQSHGPSTTELQSELDNLENSESNIAAEDSAVDSGDANQMDEANAEADANNSDAVAETDAAENNAQEKQNDNANSNSNKKEAKNSKETGDPVKITEGCYVQSDSDILINGRIPIEIIRTYKSDSNIVSSMGKGWSLNYDERIIRGCSADIKTVVDKYTEKISFLETKVEEYKQKFLSAYKVSSIENAVNEINSKINICNDNIQKINSLFSHASSLDSYMSGSSINDDFLNFKTDLQNLRGSIVAKLEILNNNLSRIESDLEVINEYEENINNLKAILEEKKIELEKYQMIKNKNRFVMFEGMDSSYEETGFETITYVDAENYPHLLYETFDGSSCWDNSKDNSIEKVIFVDEKFRVLFPNGIVKDFNKDGFLEKITDRNGNYLNVIRNAINQIVSIANSDGESLNFIYENNFIAVVKNARDTAQKVTYLHNGNKLFKIIDYENDAVSMIYDANGRMISLIKGAENKVTFKYGEESSDGKILTTETTNEEGKSEYFVYNRLEKMTKYINHDGDETLYYYDQNHRTVKQIEPDGSKIENKNDEDGNLIETVQNGDSIHYAYDSRGNLIKALYSDNSSEDYSYNNFNQVTEFTDRDGIKSEYIYDSKGNFTDLIIGGNKIFHQDFDRRGNLTKYTEYAENQIVTDYEYDSWGNLLSEKNGDSKIEFEYDDRNRVLKIKQNGFLVDEYVYTDKKITERQYNGLETSFISNERKDIVDIIQKDLKTGYVIEKKIEYDGRHLPVKIFDKCGDDEYLKEGYVYTDEGKFKCQILFARNDENNYITVCSYKNGEIEKIKQFIAKGKLSENLNEIDFVALENAAGNEVCVQEFEYQKEYMNRSKIIVKKGNGIEQFFEYDNYGNLVGIIGEKGEVIKKEYTAAGRLKREQHDFGGWYTYEYDSFGQMESAGEENSAVVKVIYNPNGTIRKTVNRYGQETLYSYDDEGKLYCKSGENKTVWYKYDCFGRVISEIKGTSPYEQGATYYLQYDYYDDDRKVILTEGGKYKTEYELDAFGNIVSEIDGNGNKRKFVYQNNQELSAYFDCYDNKTEYKYNAIGKIIQIKYPDDSKTDYEYNYMGFLTKVTDDVGSVYFAKYDKAGRLLSEKRRAESEKNYIYDGKNRIIEEKIGGDTVKKCEYGENGRKIIVCDGNGEQYLYEYDGFGRLVGEKNRSGESKQYFYDENGGIKSQKDFDESSSYVVYSSDRLEKKIIYSDGEINRFLYDSLGNIIEAENSSGKIMYEYDQGGMLIKQTDTVTGDIIQYDYDAAKNRVRIISSNLDTLYKYGKNREIIEVFDNKQRVGINFKYDNRGREIERNFANGTVQYQKYDKAGRVILIEQKGINQETIWAEGYVYDSNGKRKASVDLNGCVTLYEYNSKGQIDTVYYPYTNKMTEALSKELNVYGIASSDCYGENGYLSADLKTQLVSVMNRIGYGYGNKITNVQIFIRESFKYDKNGNCISKTTPLGTINYKYNNENYLVESSVNGGSSVYYQYDKKGNLLSEQSLSKKADYKYNAQNKLISSVVIDENNKTQDSIFYNYDALGRRSSVQNTDGQVIGTVYDGFSFNSIRQGIVMKNGMFSNSDTDDYVISNTGNPTGERYRYLENYEKDEKDGNRYCYLNEENYQSSKSFYMGERAIVFVNDDAVAQNADGSIGYFSDDLTGSVRLISDVHGNKVETYTYDISGNLVDGNLSGANDFGYIGKQFNSVTKFYNYGYRDYEASTGRFTTIDPIKDGENWFVYCNGDPVNFVDLWGLQIMNFGAYSSMSKYEEKINGSSIPISNSGCAMTGMANIITEFIFASNPNMEHYNEASHVGALASVTPHDINVSSNFSGNTICLDWNAAANSYGLTAQRSGSKEQAQEMIENASSSNEQSYVLIQVPITINTKDGGQETILHWVGDSGNVIESNAQEWIEIIPTSDNDAGRDKKNSNWMQKDGKMYVKKSAVEGAVVVKKKNK